MTVAPASLDEVRRALYAGPQATFVERRQELAGAARSAGDRDLAKVISAMRKPTAAAHVVNLLAHADDHDLLSLLELGAHIRAAMANGDDGEMRSLLKSRTAALATTAARAQAIARANGESVSGAAGNQIMQILRAGMASHDAAAAVRSGTLHDAIDEPAFGDATIEPTTRTRAPDPGRDRTSRSTTDATIDRARERAHERAHERAAARQRITAARADVKTAERVLAETSKRRDGLGIERARLVSQLAGIEEALTAAQAEVDNAQARLGVATGELDAANGSSAD